MLSSEIIKKIKKVHIKCGRTVDTMMAGQYRSVFKGAGIEFEDVREYAPGDDVKDIDWKVSARMGRPYIKRFREEREVIVMLLVDISSSGRFGTSGSLKIETAAEIAAILAFNAIRNNDKVGLILFSDKIESYIPPKKGTSHIWRVIREIFTFSAENTGTDIENALNYMGMVQRKRTVSFLISDFIDSGYEKRLKITSKKHELIGVMLSDPGDFRLPSAGIVLAEDFETGKKMILDASDRRIHERFKKRQTGAYEKRCRKVKSAGIDCLEISTVDEASDELVRYFRYRSLRSKG